MCSIYGVIGYPTPELLTHLSYVERRAQDRGRDGGQLERYPLPGGMIAYLGNHRATPTTELEKGPLQPYDGMVHNGTIANDVELGALPGEIDSQVLARVLDRSSLQALRTSLERVVGSYAFAVQSDETVYLGCNYKPVWYYRTRYGATFFSSLARHLQDVVVPGQAPVQLPPYSVMDLRTFETLPLPRQESGKVVVVASSGLDSTTGAYLLKQQGYEVTLLHFRYGCRAEDREAQRVDRIGRALGAPVRFLDLTGYDQSASPLMQGSSTAIFEGVGGAEYAHEWVPARNLLMFANAVAFAEAHGHSAVALGNNLEESGAYPDNEEQMFLHLQDAAHYAVQNGRSMRVLLPVGHLMKHEIVREGLKLGVPYELTWSCYKGGERHCGTCGPCIMRRIAFERNGAKDPCQG